MAAPNEWRGERRIESEGGAAIIAVTHDGIARMRAALGVASSGDLLDALARLDHAVLGKALDACETVEGDPRAVLAAARGIGGLDAIADALIGMVLGQTPEERDAEKKRLAAQEEARLILAVRMAMADATPKAPVTSSGME